LEQEVSSATVRNELAVLEDKGFLIKPHTSAGRIPSPEAYRLYVDALVLTNNRGLTTEEASVIRASFSQKFTVVEDAVRKAAKVISDVTNYTSVIVINNINKVVIKEIKIVNLTDGTGLLIIITDSGIIRDKVIELSNTETGYLNDANVLLNKIFAGRTVGDLKKKPASDLDAELLRFKSLLEDVVAILLSFPEENTARDIITEGAVKYLNDPETDKDNARKLLEVTSNRTEMAKLLASNPEIDFGVKIGKEETGGMDNCAVVSVKMSVGGVEIGHAGVIGPSRMEYSKVLSVLTEIGNMLSNLL
jgi:heat-inducible transcriptional repressor